MPPGPRVPYALHVYRPRPFGIPHCHDTNTHHRPGPVLYRARVLVHSLHAQSSRVTLSIVGGDEGAPARPEYDAWAVAGVLDHGPPCTRTPTRSRTRTRTRSRTRTRTRSRTRTRARTRVRTRTRARGEPEPGPEADPNAPRRSGHLGRATLRTRSMASGPFTTSVSRATGGLRPRSATAG